MELKTWNLENYSYGLICLNGKSCNYTCTVNSSYNTWSLVNQTSTVFFKEWIHFNNGLRSKGIELCRLKKKNFFFHGMWKQEKKRLSKNVHICFTRNGRATHSTHQVHQANTNVCNQSNLAGLTIALASEVPRTCGRSTGDHLFDTLRAEWCWWLKPLSPTCWGHSPPCAS